MHCEQDEIGDLQKGWDVKVVNPYERCRRARNKDADLIDRIVGAVEGAVFVEWAGFQGEEKRRGDALVDGVFGNVHEEEGKHATSC